MFNSQRPLLVTILIDEDQLDWPWDRLEEFLEDEVKQLQDDVASEWQARNG